MIEIDMQAALIIYSSCFLIGTLFTLYHYVIVKEHKDQIKYFLLFNIFATIGSLLIVFRNDLPMFVSIVLSNLLLVVGHINLCYGIQNIMGIKTKIIYPIILLIIFVPVHLYFTYIDYQVLVRVHFYNVIIIIILIHTLSSLYVKKIFRKQFMSYVLVFIIFTIIARSINLFINIETSNSLLHFKYDSFFIILMGISNLLILSGLLSLQFNQKINDILESERSKTSLLSNLPGFAYRCLNDNNWTMRFLSDGFVNVTGYDKEDVLDNNFISFEEMIHEEFRDYVRESWNQVLREHDRCFAEYKITRKDGRVIWVLEQGKGIYDEDGTCIAIEGYIADINTRKNMEDNLEFLSYRDYLTGLYNRRYIEEQIKRLNQSRNLPITILMGDINGLKFVNDSFGHSYGDELIKSVADVLRRSLRGYELISRLGGDEFLVILENTSKKDTVKIVQRIQEYIHKSDYAKMGLSVSFGFATKASTEVSLDDVVNDAEDMMYKEKLYHNPSSRRKTVDAVLATLFEKDEESEIHCRNVSQYGKLLAEAAGLNDSDIRKTETAGLLHDVGKIIIDASILKNDSILSKEEYDEIKKHSEIGYRILHNVVELRDIANIILNHHERPDGKGYPNHMKEKDIPYISKIISIADAYDAMIHKRRYKKSMSKEEAFEELKKNSGTQFDSKLVEIFIERMNKEVKD